MKKKCIIFYLITLNLSLFCQNSSAESVMPMDAGWVFNFILSKSNETSWSSTLSIIGEQEIEGKSYFLVDCYNYDNSSDHANFYISSSDTDIWMNTDGTGYLLFSLNSSVGDIYNSARDTFARYTGIFSINSPLLGNVDAYVVEQTKNTNLDGSANFSNTNLNWYEYIVPGVGIVMEIDNWTDWAPKIEQLVGITKPVPVPASVLLLGIGLIGLVAVNRKK